MSFNEYSGEKGIRKSRPAHIMNREQGRSKPGKQMNSPTFYSGQITPKLNKLIYHFLIVVGMICIAVVMGGMLGILLRSLN